MPVVSNLVATLATLFLLVVAAPGALLAQSAEGETAEAPAEAEDGLALGETIDESRKPGDTYIRETVGDWALRCVVVEAGEDRCQLYQLLEDDSDQPIAEFTLLKLPKGGQAQAAATIVVPLETSLQNQLSIKVDDQPGKRYPFSFCNQIGCFARIGLTSADVDVYKRGSKAELSIVPIAAPDVRVAVELSLSGFTAAYDKLEDATPAN